ncbi:ATP-grasp domain-containing protein [Peribacillus kribbensis]|uniref:ATP-grasp domain-containing protein n=1 Tax=Peribacillus kribbensis TaxID=356658 RepID=UPI00042467E5|nr:ATP-grasp domain-containing protein [Peribacillus kribbensis]
MKTIIFIGINKSGSSRDAVKAAVDLGYYTVVFTNQKKQLEQRKEYPDVHQLILVDSINREEISNHINVLKYQGHDIVVITSFIDQHVHIASALSDEFCHNYLSTEAIFVMENKEETRKFFKSEQFTPAFLIIEKNTNLPIEHLQETLTYPVMVKVPTSTGSKDVLFAENRTELEKNLSRIKEKYPYETIIIEEYVEGDQYLVEVLVFNEEVLTAAIVKQEITRRKRFIVTGYGVLAEVDADLEDGIGEIIRSIVSSLKIKFGAFHLELRLTQKGWKLIEINPRISGGAMNRMIQAAFGYSLVRETIQMLAGETPNLKKQTNNFVFTQHVTVDQKGVLEKITGKQKARKVPGVVEVYVKPRKGAQLTPPLSMGHRYAYVIAKGDTLVKASDAAKEAAGMIKFHIRSNDET